MADYVFVTTWRIDAPLPKIWEEIYHSERWPTWWKGVVEVVELEPAEEQGQGPLRRYTWKSFLPYTLVTDIRNTKIEHHSSIEGTITGELEGTGRWDFSEDGDETVIRFEERVSTPSRWMRLLAPLMRPAFRWNHHVIMKWGGEGLAKQLGARLIRCEEQ